MERKINLKEYNDKNYYFNFINEKVAILKQKYRFYLVPNVVNYDKDIKDNILKKDHKSKMILYYNNLEQKIYFVIFLSKEIEILCIEATNRFAYGLMASLNKKYKEIEDKQLYF